MSSANFISITWFSSTVVKTAKWSNQCNSLIKFFGTLKIRHMYIHIYVYVCICLFLYIYIYKWLERKVTIKSSSRKWVKSLALQLLFYMFWHIYQWLNTTKLYFLLMQCLLWAHASLHGICPSEQLECPVHSRLLWSYDILFSTWASIIFMAGEE